VKMDERKPDAGLYKAHYLLSCRPYNFLHLLVQNRFAVSKERRRQFRYTLGTALAAGPVAGLEALLFALPVRLHRISKDPVFIIGHWRSGTTYLQNLLCRDSQFGFCDPVSTTTFPISYLFGWKTAQIQKKVLKDARPMDNMEYTLTSPMEDVFALNLISVHSVIHLMAFPKYYENYLHKPFIREYSPADKRRWQRCLTYVMKKISLRHGGRQLVLKSPDHTCHTHELQELWPDSKFVNIHRNPYETVSSTVRMFRIQMDLLRLTDEPDNVDEVIEDAVIWIFGEMYRTLFAEMDRGAFKPGSFAELSYEELEREPIGSVKKIYDELRLPGFAEARPAIQAHIDSQKHYQKNKLTVSPRLREKINNNLGFYFTRYGYEMLTE